MPKCLRCGAGGEWIQGRVPNAAKDDSTLAAPSASGPDSVTCIGWVDELEAELRAAEKDCEIALKQNKGAEWHKYDVQRQHLKNALRVVRSRSSTDGVELPTPATQSLTKGTEK